MKRAEVIRRFVKKIRISKSGCWIWTAARVTGRMKYGWFRLDGRPEHAHRASWMLFKGRLKSPMEIVCHKCDNPPCVNPDHLFVGSHYDNKMDSVSKARDWRGGSHSKDQVKSIARWTPRALDIRYRNREYLTVSEIKWIIGAANRAGVHQRLRSHKIPTFMMCIDGFWNKCISRKYWTGKLLIPVKKGQPNEK